MRLTSRDEGGGRGGGGKEEKGGVDELHFYLGLGMSWNINCLNCERVGGRVARKKTQSEEQKSCVISPGDLRVAVAPSEEKRDTSAYMKTKSERGNTIQSSESH